MLILKSVKRFLQLYELLSINFLLMGISKNAPFPLQWRGIKGEAKQIIRVFRDALM